MIEVLAAQEFNTMISTGLPAGTREAHKTGWITGSQHDGGIVYPKDRLPYVLVILTRGIADTTVSAALARDLSRDVWQAVTAADWVQRPRAHGQAQELHGTVPAIPESRHPSLTAACTCVSCVRPTTCTAQPRSSPTTSHGTARIRWRPCA